MFVLHITFHAYGSAHLNISKFPNKENGNDDITVSLCNYNIMLYVWRDWLLSLNCAEVKLNSENCCLLFLENWDILTQFL